jgi:hypothetical protein
MEETADWHISQAGTVAGVKTSGAVAAHVYHKRKCKTMQHSLPVLFMCLFCRMA